jgi:hypothetical protein
MNFVQRRSKKKVRSYRRGLSGLFCASPGWTECSDKRSYLYIHDFLCSGILEFRRGGSRPYIKSGGGEGTGNRDRRPPRIQQQMYVPPAQRK